MFHAEGLGHLRIMRPDYIRAETFNYMKGFRHDAIVAAKDSSASDPPIVRTLAPVRIILMNMILPFVLFPL